jgi:hypothetical protein
MGLLILCVGAAAICLLVRSAAQGLAHLSRRPVEESLAGQSPHKAGALWAWIGVAIWYVVLLRFGPALTGRPVWDGAIGVALGLFVCAHPAANAIHLLFFERQAVRRVSSDGPLIRWLALNLLVLSVGWVVVFAGLRRLVERTV